MIRSQWASLWELESRDEAVVGPITAGLHKRSMTLLAVVLSQAAAPEDRWPHHLRRKERATAGSVEKMATGMARSLVGRFSGRFAMT